jgi:CRISPR-associated protein Csm4
MKAKILNLKPNSRFHFGRALADSDVSLADTDYCLHSDVLFSALVNNLATIKDRSCVECFINAFQEGKIRISSACYCLQKMDSGDLTYFIPKPVSLVNTVEQNDYEKIKLIKKVQFVTYELLNQEPKDWSTYGAFALDSETLDHLGFDKSYHALSKEAEVRIALTMYSKVLNTQVALRSINKDGQSKGPYHVSALQISDLSKVNLSVHFYFLYEITDAQFEDDFELAVSLLAYNGIGGERSSGYGQIESISTVVKLPDYFVSPTTDCHLLGLSKIIPKDAQELSNMNAYTHTVRGGRHGRGGHLKSVRMINEGAVIQGKVLGCIKSISPEHEETPNYRNGCSFTIALPDDFKLR